MELLAITVMTNLSLPSIKTLKNLPRVPSETAASPTRISALTFLRPQWAAADDAAATERRWALRSFSCLAGTVVGRRLDNVFKIPRMKRAAL